MEVFVDMARKKEDIVQVKFEVNTKQKKKLDILAERREMSVSQFCKVTSLGVRNTPAPVIEIIENTEIEKELERLREKEMLFDEMMNQYRAKRDKYALIDLEIKITGDLREKVEGYLGYSHKAKSNTLDKYLHRYL